MPLFPWRPGRSAPEAKQSRAGPLIAVTTAEGGRHGRRATTPPWRCRRVSAGAPIAYHCVRMIAEAAAAVPLGGVCRRPAAQQPSTAQAAGQGPQSRTGRSRFDGGRSSAICRSPGNGCTGSFWRRDEDRAPAELYALRPARIKTVPGRAAGHRPTSMRSADTRQVGRRPRLDAGAAPEAVSPAGRPLRVRPLEAAAFAVDVHNAMGAWNKALLDNGRGRRGRWSNGRDGGRLTRSSSRR